MRLRFVFLIAFVASVLRVDAAYDFNKMPVEAASALHVSTTATLYSLEPSERSKAPNKNLYGFKMLGQTSLDPKQTRTAVAALESAVSRWDLRLANCFDPRHALRVVANRKIYDFLLC